ncbi:MAG: HEAT repeat domain-containing protein [Candidatus Rokubacteria bacterium]|nr:HEAT repeat domain-containing protein [Candidatus Rokubacteria bacterium]
MRTLALAGLLLAAGCATFGDSSGPPPADAVIGRVELPPVGTTWVVKETSYNEGTGQGTTDTVTWTLARETVHGGRPVYHVSDGRSVQVLDRGTLGLVALLDAGGREVLLHEPHDASLSSPLWVGKQWVARFTRHDRTRNRTLRDLVVVWKVVAHEDVQVPAGTFKAFRVEAWPDERDTVRKRTYWHAPAVKLVVKEVVELAEPHRIGVGADRVRRTTELVSRTTPEAARAAARAAAPPAERAASPVEVLAKDRDPAQRAAAADALGRSEPAGAAAVVNPLATAAKTDGQANVRVAAARALMRLAASSPEAGVALAAVAATTPDALRVIGEGVQGPDTRAVAIPLLGGVGAPARPALKALLDVLRDDRAAATRVAAANAIRSIGPTSAEVPSLVRALRDPEADVRAVVATVLKDRTAEVLPPLQAELRETDPEMRRIATETLGALGRAAPGPFVPLIAASLEDRETVVRVAAVRALREVGAPALMAMREALRHDDPGVRAAAADAVVAIAPSRPEAVTAVLPLLDDAEASVRASTVRALASLGADARGALPVLGRLADGDPSPDVRALAKRAVESIR